MVGTIYSCSLVGLSPYLVQCEVDLSAQLPSLSMVGLPSALTQESRDRLRSAVMNSGLEWPARKITINLLPATLPKWGSHYELAMAMGILSAQVERELPLHIFAFGELSLSGQIRPTGWLASIRNWLKKEAQRIRSETGFSPILFAHADDVRSLNQIEPELMRDVDVRPLLTLGDAYEEFSKLLEVDFSRKVHSLNQRKSEEHKTIAIDRLTKVQGEHWGVLVALIGAVGGLHTFFAGPHGRGKSMLARSLCEISRPLSEAEIEERQMFSRMFGDSFFNDKSSAHSRPVVALQTSVTRAALEGALLSSGQILPGELTRAHRGIILADEFLEFRQDVLESFRQPLEEKCVRLQRAKLRSELPANFQLIATTNLCRCGYFGGNRLRCRCSKAKLEQGLLKLSGPILDRFDLTVLVGSEYNQEIPQKWQSWIRELLDTKSWVSRLQFAWENFSRYESSPLLFNPHTNPGSLKSHRSAAKDRVVEKSIALFDGCLKAQKRHEEIRHFLRRDIEDIIRNQMISCRYDGYLKS